MARSTVKLIPKGMRELLQSPEVVSMLESRMEPVLEAAKADPHDVSGDYENGLFMVTYIGRNRARTRVQSGDPKGHILEAKYGILSRALDAAGGRRA